MLLVNLFLTINVALGLILKKNNGEREFDPTKNNLVDIYNRGEKLGLGVIIYDSFVITLASIAVIKTSQLTARSSVTDEEYKIIDKRLHEKYSASTISKQYNIAVLKVKTQSKFLDIKLDPKKISYYPDTIITFSGWSWSDGGDGEEVYVSTPAVIEQNETCIVHYKSKFSRVTDFCVSDRSENKYVSNGIPGSLVFYHGGNESSLLGLLTWSNESDKLAPSVFIKIPEVRNDIIQAIRSMCSDDEKKKLFPEPEVDKDAYWNGVKLYD